MRDPQVILSLEHSPGQYIFGRELYPTVFEKAGVYARDIIMRHPFVDGNKRTGITAALVFLEDNDYLFTAKDGELEIIALKIITGRLDIASIADWFKEHSKENKNGK